MVAFRRTPSLLSLLLSLLSTATATSFTPNTFYYIDCGATRSINLSNDSPPRIFKSDDGSNLISSENTLSLSNPNNNFTGSLYSTARASYSIFTYKFNMDPNAFNVLRLHFLPFSAPSYELSTAKFSVHALNYILLDNFTVSDTASPTIKEFFLWTYSSDLEVQFIPQSKSIAFVSAIEAFTAPQEMLNHSSPTPIGDTTISGDLVNQALETMYRVNMPGPLITPESDTMWRTWVTDDLYIYSAYGSNKTSVSTSPHYVPSQGRSEEIAPPTVYKTARTMNVSDVQFISNPGFNNNITWSFRVDSGYQYLIRLHFCDIISETNSLDKDLVFIVYIMNYSALIDNLKISDYTTYPQEPFYIDFIAHVMSAQNITVSISMDRIGSKTKNALLNGLEILKVNNLGGTTNLSLGKKNSLAVILGATIGGVIVIALILSCTVVVSIKKRHQRRTADVKQMHLLWSPMTGGGTTTIGASPRVDLGLLISFAQIKIATDNFDEKNLIGVGGFGKVYKGILSNGVEVAVKRASSRSQQGFPEFQTEIEVQSQIRHRHLVSLIGYCDESSEMILVYEYMEKGPLRNYLYGNESSSLSWKRRLEICIDAAKGLHYLHTGYSQTIIHRDVKSTNILLGEGYLAKVSDFGLSKLGASMGETHFSTAVKGTFGYLDPEYFKTQKLTDKSDVYSFGVMLLEVLCARPVIDQSLAREKINLAEWALMWLSRGQLEKIIDPRLVGEIKENSLRKFGEIAEKCLKEYGMDRPAIGHVLWNLEYCLQLQETEVRREPYDDSGISEAHFPLVPFVRRMPSSVVSHGTATSGERETIISMAEHFRSFAPRRSVEEKNGWHRVISRRQQQYLRSTQQTREKQAKGTITRGKGRVPRHTAHKGRQQRSSSWHHWPIKPQTHHQRRHHNKCTGFSTQSTGTLSTLLPFDLYFTAKHGTAAINGINSNTNSHHYSYSTKYPNENQNKNTNPTSFYYPPTTSRKLMANNNQPKSTINSNSMQPNPNPPPNIQRPQNLPSSPETPFLPQIITPPHYQSNQRYSTPPWPHFMDHNPWRLTSFQNASATRPSATMPNPLPLPPHPRHHEWRGRCYNCLKFGHDQSICRSDERVCPKCWTKGHEAKFCPQASNATRFDPLQPRGNMGEAGLPPNRPELASIFIPETTQMRQDTLEFNRAIVIDARLRPNHTTNIIQSILMSTCNSEYPYQLTHMSGHQYLLLLPVGADRHRFLLSFTRPLQELGYVLFPWSLAVNGYPMRLKYKIWIELRRVTPQAWTIDHLIPAVSSFGIVLDHTPMNRATTLESMKVVMAVDDLSKIPKGILMWLRGVGHIFEVVVRSWLEEPLPLIPPLDPTPKEEFFEQVKQENIRVMTGFTGNGHGSSVVAADFDMLFTIWKALEEGPDKIKLEQTLKASSQWDAAIKAYNTQISEGQATAVPNQSDEEYQAAERARKGKGTLSDELEASGQRATGEGNFVLIHGPSPQHATVQNPAHGPATVDGTVSRGIIQISNQNPTQINPLTQLEHQLFGPQPGALNNLSFTNTPTQILYTSFIPQNQSTAQNTPPSAAQITSPLPNPTNPIHSPTDHSNPILEPLKCDPLPDNNGIIHIDSDEEPIEIEPEEELSEIEPEEELEEEVPIIPDPLDLTEQLEEGDEYLADGWDNFDNTAYEDYEEENFSPQDPDPPILSPYHTPSPAGEFDNELRVFQEEVERENIEAQLEAQLAVQEHMDFGNIADELPQGDEFVHEGADTGSVMAENEPQLTAATGNSTTLRRSARINNRGVPKKYGTKRTWTKKNWKDEAAAKRRTILEAELLETLQDEALSAAPLQQERVAQVNLYCGMNTGVDTEAGPSNAMDTEEKGDVHEDESVLATFDFDSEEELTDEEESPDLGTI